MANRPWMPLYIADYIAATVHLSPTEDSAYMRLIMHYWQYGGLPVDGARLARIARLSLKEWHAIRDTIAAFFGPDWTHKRIDKEMEKTADVVSKRSAAGRASAAARASKRAAEAQHMPQHMFSKFPYKPPVSYNPHSTVRPSHEGEYTLSPESQALRDRE